MPIEMSDSFWNENTTTCSPETVTKLATLETLQEAYRILESIKYHRLIMNNNTLTQLKNKGLQDSDFISISTILPDKYILGIKNGKIIQLMKIE